MPCSRQTLRLETPSTSTFRRISVHCRMSVNTPSSRSDGLLQEPGGEPRQSGDFRSARVFDLCFLRAQVFEFSTVVRIQLDGDNLRNAFLNAPWVKAVIPIRPGKEKAAINWLKGVEGMNGITDDVIIPFVSERSCLV